MDLSLIKKIHFTGIKGVGMTSLALLAKDLGIKVTGSDTAETFVTNETLAKAGISCRKRFSAWFVHKKKPDLLIYSGAHYNNKEIKKAEALGIPVMPYGKALGKFMEGKKAVSVCGVGGKTTTSAMISAILVKAGLYPSYAVGVSGITCLKSPAKYDKKGEWFVAEADEYIQSPKDKTPKFLSQNPKIIVLTNLVFDHPDVYASFKQTKNAFEKFLKKTPSDGLLTVCADNFDNIKLASKIGVPFESYGFSLRSNWRIKGYKQSSGKSFFSLYHNSRKFSDFLLNIPGRFNVLNAAASIVACNFIGVNKSDIKKGLENFTGVKRRFEKIAAVGSNLVYDDYAHHPLEIQAALNAAKKFFSGKKIMVIFQSHTYSRTKALFDDFSKAFGNADFVIITDIYASAREKEDFGVSGKKLAKQIQKHHQNVKYLAGKNQVISLLKKNKPENTVIFTMGAGDIYLWHEDLAKTL